MREEDPALAAYEALAPYYDDFTAGYAHDQWLAVIEGLLESFGLRGRRILDVACGTGKSALPLLRRGYEVTACDISPGMVAAARRRLGLSAQRVFAADMRKLPALPAFDAITCLDDAVNYLTREQDVAAAFRSIRRVLRPGGLFAFDVNTLATYRELFAGHSTRTGENATFRWRGWSSREVKPGSLFRATVEVARAEDTGGASVTSSHLQRHYPVPVLERLLRRARLEPLAVYGQSSGARLSTPPDEFRYSKSLFIVRRPDRGEAP
ncbi:MAG: class I SAM-dependent methyltransferase [Thermoleophilaceae bacterium]